MNTEEIKIQREKRKALLFDYTIAVLITAIALQVTVPSVIPLVQAMQGEPAAATVQVPKAPSARGK